MQIIVAERAIEVHGRAIRADLMYPMDSVQWDLVIAARAVRDRVTLASDANLELASVH